METLRSRLETAFIRWMPTVEESERTISHLFEEEIRLSRRRKEEWRVSTELAGKIPLAKETDIITTRQLYRENGMFLNHWESILLQRQGRAKLFHPWLLLPVEKGENK